jgi:hypothetical protein
MANTTQLHQAPELEAQLPASVGGRALATWSLRGRCWLELALNGGPSDIDAFVAKFETANDRQLIDLAHLDYAVAGRSDTKADPPFFVFAAGRSRDDDEVRLATVLLFGGASFHDIATAGDLSLYERRTIARKDVYVGNTDMLGQTEHQRGRPYLYQNDDAMFLLITDEERWAEDALSQLP